MSTWIALLRGIGGGIRTLPMKELKAELETLGLKNVRTYIQTGNVVFDNSRTTTAAKLAKRIDDCVTERFGFESKTMVLSVDDLQRAVRNNPYPQAEEAPTTVHLFFMDEPPPAPKLEEMARWRAKGDEYALKGSVFYFHTPGGVSNSKLSQKIERLLGVPATARNWRTVCAVLAMAKERVKDRRTA